MVAKKGKRTTKRVKDLPTTKRMTATQARSVKGGTSKIIGVTKWPNIVLKKG